MIRSSQLVVLATAGLAAAVAVLSWSHWTAYRAGADRVERRVERDRVANREAVIAEEGGKLVLSLGPDRAKRYPLTHFDRDTFVYAFSPELPTLLSSAVFAIGPDGKAAQVTLDDFAGTGAAALPRVAE